MEKSILTKQEADRELREEFTDALFCLLAGKALDRETRHFMEETEPPTETELKAFSGILDRLYTRYSRQKFFKTAYNVLSKVSVVIVAVICVFSVTVINVAAIREPLLDWVFRYYADRTQFSFPGAEGISEIPQISFGYLPEGFTPSYIQSSENGAIYELGNSEGKLITLVEHQLTTVSNIDTENADVRYQVVEDYVCMIIRKDYEEENKMISVIWHDNTVMYNLSSNAVNEDELLEIVKGIMVK